MSLSGEQRQKLHNALIHAFPDKASLERMVSDELYHVRMNTYKTSPACGTLSLLRRG